MIKRFLLPDAREKMSHIDSSAYCFQNKCASERWSGDIRGKNMVFSLIWKQNCFVYTLRIIPPTALKIFYLQPEEKIKRNKYWPYFPIRKQKIIWLIILCLSNPVHSHLCFFIFYTHRSKKLVQPTGRPSIYQTQLNYISSKVINYQPPENCRRIFCLMKSMEWLSLSLASLLFSWIRRAPALDLSFFC